MREFNIGIIGLGNIGLEVYKNIKKDLKSETGIHKIVPSYTAV